MSRRASYRGWRFLLLLLYMGSALAAVDFPSLTGRVVDAASLLPVDVQQQLQQQLERHEQETSNQVVVVTLPSLQGYAIDDYGYQLGRHWGIGQAERDNGVLLIVAPSEREVRIEVGYGLEGVLTDAGSHAIIQDVMLPEFRDNHYESGILQGVDAMLGTLQGTYEPVARRPAVDHNILFMLFLFLISVGERFASLFGSRLMSAGDAGWYRRADRLVAAWFAGHRSGAGIVCRHLSFVHCRRRWSWKPPRLWKFPQWRVWWRRLRWWLRGWWWRLRRRWRLGEVVADGLYE